MLHYRSKRRGFTTYTAGQLKAVAQTYFKTEMGIEVKMMVILVMLVVGGSPQRVKTSENSICTVKVNFGTLHSNDKNDLEAKST